MKNGRTSFASFLQIAKQVVMTVLMRKNGFAEQKNLRGTNLCAIMGFVVCKKQWDTMFTHYIMLTPSPKEKHILSDPFMALLVGGVVKLRCGLIDFLEPPDLGIKAKDNQSRYEIVRDFRAHLQQVYADRSLEEWLQARFNI